MVRGSGSSAAGRLALGLGAALVGMSCTGPIPPPGPTPPPPPSGSLTTSYGTNGVLTSNPSTRSDLLAAMVPGISGVFLLVGADEGPAAGDWQWRVEARDQYWGALDNRFGLNGVATSNPGSGNDQATAIVTDATYMYVGGFEDASGDRQWRIEKRASLNAFLDAGFGTAGVLTISPSTGTDAVVALAADTSDLYVVGYDEAAGAGDFGWRIEKRSLATGLLVNGFGTNGVVTSNPSSLDDRPTAALWDGTYLYVVGFDESAGAGDRGWRIERRLPTDGSLDTTFGTGGVVSVNPSSGIDQPLAIVRDTGSGDVVVAGTDESAGAGDSGWRIEKRASSGGALVSGFGASGVVTVNPSTGNDVVSGLVAAGAGFYAIGFDESAGPGDTQWRIERRRMTTGAPVAAFGTSGVVTSNPSTGDDRAVVGALGTWGLHVAGTENGTTDRAWRVELRVP